MKPLRVAHVLHSLAPGGKERVAVELARHALETGDRHRLLLFDAAAPTDAFDLDPGDVAVLGLPRRRGADWGYPRRLRAELAREPCDAVHAHNDSALVFAERALARLRPRPRLVATFHNLPSHATLAARWLARRAARRAEAVVCVSEELAQRLRSSGWVGSSRVIANGVDAERFAPKASALGWRAQQLVPRECLLVGCVARLAPEKRQADLVAAVRQARATGLDVRLVLVGDGPLRAEFAAAAQADAWLYQVPFEREVARLLVELDVFALASSHEGLPMSVLEAMACARPIVATNVGGLPELFPDGERHGAILVQSADVGGLARAFARLADPALRETLGRRARERVCERFTLAATAAAYRELYAG